MKHPGIDPLLTDWYQLTMAAAWIREGRGNEEAVFDLYFRRAPFGSAFAIACGVQSAVEWLDHFGIADDEAEWLERVGGLSHEDVIQLHGLRFSGEVLAVAEGEAVFPDVPVMRVRAPIIQAQLIETALLNHVNFQTLIATKAARIVDAAKGDPVIDFGLRRAQGADGAVSASRAAYVGGCSGTSNVAAARRFDIPLKGTHAHSWVMAHGSELEAFRAYADAFPDAPLFLVDTYDTLESGIPNAITVLDDMRRRGLRPRAAIRLDSGPLAELSIRAHSMFEEAGYPDPLIVASSDLDEHRIAQLKRDGAKINSWGVGTRLVTGHDEPALGGVYKLAAIEREGELQPCEKRSDDPDKSTLGGIKVPVRWSTAEGRPVADVIHFEGHVPEDGAVLGNVAGRLRNGEPCVLEGPLQARHLLRPVYEDFRPVDHEEPLSVARARALASVNLLGRDRYGAGHVLLISASASS